MAAASRLTARFSRATAVVVSMANAIDPIDKSLIVIIELVLLALDGAATLARFFNVQQPVHKWSSDAPGDRL
jgi:hypothetical protein